MTMSMPCFTTAFFSNADRSTIDIIQKTPEEELGKLELNVSDKRIKPLLFRYRARNFPMTLDYQEQQQWKHHCQDFFEAEPAKLHAKPRRCCHGAPVEREEHEDPKSCLRLRTNTRVS